jgi:hypothetical protein
MTISETCSKVKPIKITSEEEKVEIAKALKINKKKQGVKLLELKCRGSQAVKGAGLKLL